MEDIFEKQDTFGDVLRMYRSLRKLTKAELAVKACISVGSVSKYERAGYSDGQYPPLPKFAKLVYVLKINPSDLLRFLGETDDEVHFLGREGGDPFESLGVIEDQWEQTDKKMDQGIEMLKSLAAKVEALEAKSDKKKNPGSLATAPSSLDDED